MNKFIYTLFFCICSILSLNAQWEQTNCPVAYTGALIVSGTNIFAGTTSGVFLSTNNGVSWTAVNSGLTNTNVYSLAKSGTNIFAGTTGGVFLSTNNGTSWANSGLSNFGINSLAVSSTNIFAGAALDGVFLSTNNGTSWTPVNTGLSTLYPVTALTVSGSYVFAGTDGDGVFRSSDNGSNWMAVNAGLGDWGIMSFAVSGTTIFAGCFWGSVARSTNNGTDWFTFGFGSPGEIFALTLSGSNIFAGTGFEGVFHSTDNGTSWLAMNSGLPMSVDIRSLVANDMFLYAGTVQSGVWRFPLSSIPVELMSFTANSNGREVIINWVTATETNNKGFEVQRSEENEFVPIGFVEGHGTTTESQAYSYLDKNVATGDYKYRLKQINYDGTFEYSNVIEVEVTSPSTFSLEQNYPNPFNPTTTIKYSIPSSEFVTLKVYDVLGNEVATLVNEEKPAGSYEVEFSADDLTSGIYFYTLTVGSFVDTRKLILMK